MAARISLTRAQYLDAVRASRTAAAEMTARLDIGQMTWQPRNGQGWSICECLDHIAISIGAYLDAMQSAIGQARAGTGSHAFYTAGFASTRFTRDMEPPPRMKIPAPGKIRPRATLNPDAIPPECLRAMDRVSTLVASTGNRNLNAVRFQNPLIPLLRFTVSTGFLIVAAHTRRHLWQADQVTKDPEFPGLQNLK